jgi:hypothetical protein
MATTKIEYASKDITLFKDFQVFLRGIWKSDIKRDWTIYTIDHQSEFWSTRDIVDRPK